MCLSTSEGQGIHQTLASDSEKSQMPFTATCKDLSLNPRFLQNLHCRLRCNVIYRQSDCNKRAVSDAESRRLSRSQRRPGPDTTIADVMQRLRIRRTPSLSLRSRGVPWTHWAGEVILTFMPCPPWTPLVISELPLSSVSLGFSKPV